MTARHLRQSQERTMEARGKETLTQEGTRPGWLFRPDVDIVEQQEEYLVSADLPGVGESDLQVHLDKGILTIDAQPSVVPDNSWQPRHAEYRIGAYHREFTMGDEIDSENISARVKDGVLEIRLPKIRQQQPRRIAIARG